MISKTMCFSGHRKMDGKWVTQQNFPQLYQAVVFVVTEMVKRGYTDFISGAATGFDTLAAWAVLEVKKTYPQTRLVMALPFPSQGSKWPEQQRKEYQQLLASADLVYEVSPDPYAAWKLEKRNRWMVDNSCCTITCWDGTPKGGTFNHYTYATKMRGQPIIHITRTGITWPQTRP